MRLLDFFRACRMTIDVFRARGAGLRLRKNGVCLRGVVARDCDRQHLVLGEVFLDR